MQVDYQAAYGFNMFNLVIALTCDNSGHIHAFPHVQDSNGCTYVRTLTYVIKMTCMCTIVCTKNIHGCVMIDIL